MTEKVTTKKDPQFLSEYHKLSIQVSLNGLSFCVLDTISNKVVLTEKTNFSTKTTPKEVQQKLKDLFDTHSIEKKNFSEIKVIHKNNLFSFVPKALFNKEYLAHYLKFNAEIISEDHIVYDELDTHDMVNVYIPFVNINNFLYDLFGEFEFKHSATIMVASLLNAHASGTTPTAYLYLEGTVMDLTILHQNKLLLHNSFNCPTKEDTTYYLLYALDQLNLDPEEITIRAFGTIEEEDALYKLLFSYLKNLSIFVPENPEYIKDIGEEPIDFTVINSL